MYNKIMKLHLPYFQFLLLALSTAFATYFFNEALMAGQYIFVVFGGAILVRNLRVSYQLSKIIKVIEDQVNPFKQKKRPGQK